MQREGCSLVAIRPRLLAASATALAAILCEDVLRLRTRLVSTGCSMLTFSDDEMPQQLGRIRSHLWINELESRRLRPVD